MAYTNDLNNLEKVSLMEFIKFQKPYKEVRYFIGDNAYISINKNYILFNRMEFLTNSRIISEAIISVDHRINRLTLFSSETEQSMEFNFHSYVRW
ncbi:MAG: hypothetical protein H0X03_07990 [Nitrosopumilus sp.]|nr:hypothetical protein [Nitrosopumilus sp.]